MNTVDGVEVTCGFDVALHHARGDEEENYRGFLAAVRDEAKPPALLAEAAHTVEILDAARASARTGLTVDT